MAFLRSIGLGVILPLNFDDSRVASLIEGLTFLEDVSGFIYVFGKHMRGGNAHSRLSCIASSLLIALNFVKLIDVLVGLFRKKPFSNRIRKIFIRVEIPLVKFRVQLLEKCRFTSLTGSVCINLFVNCHSSDLLCGLIADGCIATFYGSWHQKLRLATQIELIVSL